MASQQQHAPGGHYSGHNPIPTVKQFIENLDKDKAERDRQIDQQAKEGKGPTPAQKGLATSTGRDVTASSGAEPHKMQKRSIEGTEQTVTDPVTGNQVTISDVDKSMMSEVENPHVVIPNANLNKDTVRTLNLKTEETD